MGSGRGGGEGRLLCGVDVDAKGSRMEGGGGLAEEVIEMVVVRGGCMWMGKVAGGE